MFASSKFGIELFSSIIHAAKSRDYAFLRFDEDINGKKKIFYLRHDVDISPRNALSLGREAERIGIKSNLFFQMNAETYQIFSTETLDIMKMLRDMGHLVGLHVDQEVLSDDEAKISETIDWFNRNVAGIDNAISFHRPTPEVVGRRFARFLNAYDPQFFNPDLYLSDSRRSLDFLPRLEATIASATPMIQLLLHPEWWSHLTSAEAVWASLQSRRNLELNRYVKFNFKKVFVDVAEIEDRDFGI